MGAMLRAWQQAVTEVEEEFVRAATEYAPFHSPHEGFSILREEVDELWDEVKKNPATRTKALMRAEAIQVAAMALRFMVDCCQEDAPGKSALPNGANTPGHPDYLGDMK